MQLGKALPHPNSNGRDRSGGILALLTSSLLLAAGAALARPDCADWNTVQFFEEATAADVGRCISQGADPKARDEKGWTPLHLVMNPVLLNPGAMDLLLAAGADPNARTENGDTPLHWVAMHVEEDVWTHLPQKTLEALAVSMDRLLPLQVKKFLAAGADLEARNKDGWTPLHRAAAHSKSPAMVKVLVDAGANLEARADLGATPLHHAAFFSETPAVVKVLLDAGADPNARADGGVIPVELVPDDSPLRGTDVYWRLNEGRYR